MEDFDLEKRNAENWAHTNKEILMCFFIKDDFVKRTMNEIHEHFDIPTPRMVRIVDRGIEYGYLRKDRNNFNVRLTSKGMSIVLDVVRMGIDTP